MIRTTPAPGNEEIDLYIRTYYSLLRSSAPIRLRSLEESHAATNSNLHYDAAQPDLDVSALTYSALRLPPQLPGVELVLMGQMEEVFARAGYPAIDQWQPVRARARRRKFYLSADGKTLAAFVASVSDIDDLIPALTAYQIEWNKIHQKLTTGSIGVHQLGEQESLPQELLSAVQSALGLGDEDFAKLQQAWTGPQLARNLRQAAKSELDIRVRALGSGLSDYRRAVQLWWSQVAEGGQDLDLAHRPIYFVSSNIHGLPNLISGYVRSHSEEILDYLRRENPENLWPEYQRLTRVESPQTENLLYYASRLYLQRSGAGSAADQHAHLHETDAGIVRLRDPHCLDVEAQLIDVRRLRQDWLDPRLGQFSPQEWALLGQSDALIFNIDYPLGMAAYHLFSQVSTAVSGILGVYILGKAATLNGRVGDVMAPNVVYDEHSHNSYLFQNCFSAQQLSPFLTYGTVFDNQKAVTVRGTFLQNREFMHVFYEEGYTDIEMEAGPYLSAIYENIYPKRYPTNEIVNLFINAPYDIGLIHYASDTPISRRQILLSKSLSFFGVDATYAACIAVLRRILSQEIARQQE